MRAESRPDETVSIIVLPGGDEGRTLLELVADWTEHGYLGRAYWLRPEDVVIQRDAPPIVTATVFGRNDVGHPTSVRRDLFHLMAVGSLRRITLLTVRSAHPDLTADAAQDEVRRSITEYVQHAVPKEPHGSTAARLRIDLTRMTLICAPTEFVLHERVDWVEGDDTLTIVASPEDRATPWSGDAFVRGDERFPGFVLMHAATVAGVWAGLPFALPDLLDREPSANGGVWLTRSFVSGIVTATLEAQASRDVVRSAADPESSMIDPYSGILADGTAPIPPGDMAKYRDAMVKAALEFDGGVLRYRRPVDDPPVERVRLSPGAQLRAFGRFSGGVLRSTPRAWWQYVRRGLARVLHRGLQGGDRGLYAVDAELDRLDQQDRAIAAELEQVRSQQAALDAEFQTPIPPSASISTPILWSELRESVFGALDGSGDPGARGFPIVEDRIPVFARVADVMHDPSDIWNVPRGLVDGLDRLAPLDGDGQDTVRTALHERISASEQALAEADAEVTGVDREEVELTARRAEIRPYLAHAGVLTTMNGREKLVDVDAVTLPPSSNPDEVAASLREYRETVGRSAALDVLRREAERRRTVAEKRAEADAEVLGEFEMWAARHGANFGAGLMQAIEAERRAADADAKRGIAELKQFELPKPGRLVELRDRYHTWAGILTGAVLAVVAGAAVVLLAGSGDWSDRDWGSLWPIVLGCAGVLVAGILALLVAYYRGWSAFHRSVLESEDRLFAVHERTIRARRETGRLSSLSRQAREWLDLLAAAMRRPSKLPSSDAADQGADDEGLAVDASADGVVHLLPFAMRLATADLRDPELVGRYRRTAASALVRRGWRADAFERMLQGISTTQGIRAESVDLAALDRDLPHLPNHARRILRDHLDHDDVLEYVGAHELEHIRLHADFGPLNAGISRVTPLTEHPLAELVDDDDSGTPGWAEFLGAAFGSAVDRATPLTPLAISPYQLQDGHHERVRSFALARARVAELLGLADRSDLSLRTVDTRPRSFEPVIRIDVIGPVPVDAVRLGLASALESAVAVAVTPRARPIRSSGV